MPRLLLFCPGVARGGCEEYALAVGAEATRRGYLTYACCPNVAGTRSLRVDLFAAGAALQDWEVLREAGGDCWSGYDEQKRQAIDVMTRLRPDKVWLALPWVDSATGVLAACGELRLGGLCVWQLAGETPPIPNAHCEPVRRSLDAGLRWVAVCLNNRAFIAESHRVPPEAIKVVYNGLISRTPPQRLFRALRLRYRAEVRRELGLPACSRLAVTVARLCLEQKGHDVLLEAVAELADQPDLHFVFAGDGADRQRVVRMVRDAGLGSKVTILGARLDVPRLLTAADVFVLPSRLEGVPFAVCEALAFGCPVIATAVGGVPEILTHRVNGLLVDPEDSGKLAKMIRYALSSERIRDRLSRNGRSTAERLSSTGMFAQSFALLEERDPASSGAVDDGGM